MPTKTKPMTEGAPWLHVLKFSLPVLAGSTMQQLYNTVDAIVVGNYSGEDALAAVGTTGSFIFLLHAIAIGLSAGTGVVVAQFFGAKDERQVRANAASGASFLLTLGAILTILGIAVSRPAFDAFVGVPDDFLEQTLLYFRLYCVGLVFQFEALALSFAVAMGLAYPYRKITRPGLVAIGLGIYTAWGLVGFALFRILRHGVRRFLEQQVAELDRHFNEEYNRELSLGTRDDLHQYWALTQPVLAGLLRARWRDLPIFHWGALTRLQRDVSRTSS